MHSRKKDQPALRRAIDFILNKLNDQNNESGPRLPSITDLARECNVSRPTMHKALHIVEKQGMVTVMRNGGTVIRGEVPVAIPETDNTPRFGSQWWSETLEKKIVESITVGHYPPGSLLPTYKELCVTYGTSYRFIKPVLERLAQRGIIIPYKKRFKVYVPPQVNSRSSIVVILPNKSFSILDAFPGSDEFWKTIGTESSRYGIHIDIVGTEKQKNKNGRNDQKELPQYIENVSKHTNILGFIILNLFRKPAENRHLTYIASLNKPMAIFDPRGINEEWYPPGNGPIYLINPTASETPGEIVANYLLSQGHRHLAIFPAPVLPDWSLTRIAGMKKVFASAQIPEEQLHVILPSIANPQEELLYDEQQRIRNEIKAFTSKLNPFYKGKEIIAGNIFQLPYIKELIMYYRFHDQFTSLIANESITAWVGLNDTIALAAYTFLMEKKIPVPGAISVIGFDNTKESFYYDLTSYSFNVSASVQALFRCIMVNDRRSQKKRVQKIQIPGTIIVRNTTKRM